MERKSSPVFLWRWIYIASEYMLGLGRESDICIFIHILFILRSESYIAMVSALVGDHLISPSAS